MSKTFHLIYDILAANNNGKEPMMNILAWYGLERTKEDFGEHYEEEFESVAEHPYNCIIFLRSKHRPRLLLRKKETNKFSSVLLLLK